MDHDGCGRDRHAGGRRGAAGRGSYALGDRRRPDAWGSPATYLLLPGILAFCNAVMSLVVRRLDPETWSRPDRLREEDKPRWWQTSVSVATGCEAVLGGWLLVDSLLTVLQLSELMLPSVLALLAALAAVIAVPPGQVAPLRAGRRIADVAARGHDRVVAKLRAGC